MRTIREFEEFINSNENEKLPAGNGFEPGMEQIIQMLRQDESVTYITTSGGVDRRNASTLWVVSIAVTNERLIIGGNTKMMFKPNYVANAYDIAKISSVNVSKVNYTMSNIIIETTANDDLTIQGYQTEKAIQISRGLTNAIEAVKAAKSNNNAATVIQQSSPADELKKFKELLDLGIITQEEFDAKKKQILGM